MPTLPLLIAYFAFVIAIMLPIVVLLLNDFSRSISIDRRLIIERILKLPIFIFLTSIICVLFFIELFLPMVAVYLRPVWSVVVAIFTCFMILVVTSAISWLRAADYSTIFNTSYREASRLKYLNSRPYRKAFSLWGDFWYDERAYQLLGEDHLSCYLEAYLRYISSLPRKNRLRARAFFAILRCQMMDIFAVHDEDISQRFLPTLLRHYDDLISSDPELAALWGDLICEYLRLSLGSSLHHPWSKRIYTYLVDSPIITNPEAIAALSTQIYEFFQDSRFTYILHYLEHNIDKAPQEYKPLFNQFKAIFKAKNATKLTKYLQKQAAKSLESANA